VLGKSIKPNANVVGWFVDAEKQAEPVDFTPSVVFPGGVLK